MKLIPGVERVVDDPDRVVVIGIAPGAEHHRAEAEELTLTPVPPNVLYSISRTPPFESRAG